MVAKNLFRPRQAVNRNDMFQQAPATTPASYAQKQQEHEEQLAHLSQQKELHTLALKEMYQFICKLDNSFREENQKLRDQIAVEQNRSAKLIEVTKGLWDIIELMDDGEAKPLDLAEELTREVKQLAALEVEISDESDDNFPNVSDIAPMIAAVG